MALESKNEEQSHSPVAIVNLPAQHVEGIVAIPSFANLSQEEIAFLEQLNRAGGVGSVVSIMAYHNSPSANRASIAQHGLRNIGPGFTESQQNIFRSFCQRFPQKAPNYNVQNLIFGFRDNERRGIFVSFSAGTNDCYPISETIRLYFSVLSENFDLLTPQEQSEVVDTFKDFNTKLSIGTDTWQIKAIENPELLKSILPILMNQYDWFPETFTDGSNLISEPNYEFLGSISPRGMVLLKTEYKSPIEMWTSRCARLIEML